MHFLGGECDYKETLNLEKGDLNKIKLITGSIRKGPNEDTIHLNFFGKRLTVSKRVNVVQDDVVEVPECLSDDLSPEQHRRTMKQMFSDLNNPENVDSEENENQRKTQVFESDKLLGAPLSREGRS